MLEGKRWMRRNVGEGGRGRNPVYNEMVGGGGAGPLQVESNTSSENPGIEGGTDNLGIIKWDPLIEPFR